MRLSDHAERTRSRHEWVEVAVEPWDVDSERSSLDSTVRYECDRETCSAVLWLAETRTPDLSTWGDGGDA